MSVALFETGHIISQIIRHQLADLSIRQVPGLIGIALGIDKELVASTLSLQMSSENEIKLNRSKYVA